MRHIHDVITRSAPLGSLMDQIRNRELAMRVLESDDGLTILELPLQAVRVAGDEIWLSMITEGRPDCAWSWDFTDQIRGLGRRFVADRFPRYRPPPPTPAAA